MKKSNGSKREVKKVNSLKESGVGLMSRGQDSKEKKYCEVVVAK